MPEPFKNRFSLILITQMADCFAKADASFQKKDFVALAANNIENLELKQRSEQICMAMQRYLPEDFEKSAKILLESLCPMTSAHNVSDNREHAHLLKNWAVMPMADYVASYRHTHFELCIQLLYEMTQRFTAEFAIRHLLMEQQDKTLALLKTWLVDSSEHVRRLVSEGTRPRLPWGIQLSEFIRDPNPILPLLEALKDDPSEYVRRSVANNLNDIAKDHPQLVIAIAQKWLVNASKARIRLIKHACRTLFKQAHPEALALFGFLPVRMKAVDLFLGQSSINMGESIDIELSLRSNNSKAQNIMLDYVVYHKKANGKLLPKVFKWKVLTLDPNQTLRLCKTHSFKAVTTRKYYAGEQRIAVLINGKTYGLTSFQLLS